MKVDPTVRRETLYIAACVLVLSAVMELVFLALQMWDVSVLWGNLLGGAAAVLNYFLMGLTIQHAVGMDAKHAASKMHLSQALRMLISRCSIPSNSISFSALLCVWPLVPKPGIVIPITLWLSSCSFSQAFTLASRLRVESRPPEMPNTNVGRPSCCIRLTRPDT